MDKAQYFRPEGVEQALALAKAHQDDYIYSAGGTDVQINRKQSLLRKSVIIDLSEIGDLRGISITENALVIGAMTALDELISSPEIHAYAPLLAEAARSIATPVIRMTATVGGNILVANRCSHYNQSAEWRESAGSCLRDHGDSCLITGGQDKCFSRSVSDLAPALMALDARVVIQNQVSQLRLPLDELYAPDGIQYHAHLENDAIITAVHIMLRPERWWYRKLRRRDSIDFSSLTVAAVRVDSTLRLCLNGISMSPVLVVGDTKTSSAEELARQARRQAKPVDNDLMPLAYRRDMVDVFVNELWGHCVGPNKEMAHE